MSISGKKRTPPRRLILVSVCSFLEVRQVLCSKAQDYFTINTESRLFFLWIMVQCYHRIRLSSYPLVLFSNSERNTSVALKMIAVQSCCNFLHSNVKTCSLSILPQPVVCNEYVADQGWETPYLLPTLPIYRTPPIDIRIVYQQYRTLFYSIHVLNLHKENSRALGNFVQWKPQSKYTAYASFRLMISFRDILITDLTDKGFNHRLLYKDY